MRTYIASRVQGDARMSTLEQAVLQLQQDRPQDKRDLQLQATTFGPKFILGVARELMLFAIGEQPRADPPGNSIHFQNQRLQTNLQTFAQLLEQSGKVPMSYTPSQLGAAMDGIIVGGDSAVHRSSRSLLEADISNAKNLMARHPCSQRQCPMEALLIDAYDILKQAFQL